jgi:phytoene dehydrogenase-like protein
MGAGHKGPVVAAYLAKAGKKVMVLERKGWPGGGVYGAGRATAMKVPW